MSDRYLFDSPNRITVGTVGPVGERLFVLQAREGSLVVTVKVEKIQVATLASYLGRMLHELSRPDELPGAESLQLEEFSEPDFTAEALALSYDELSDRIVLVVDEFDADEASLGEGGAPEPRREVADLEVASGDGAVARLVMTREQAAALAIRATELVAAGRPPCPLCGFPLDPRGHVCPRTNGHRPPLT